VTHITYCNEWSIGVIVGAIDVTSSLIEHIDDRTRIELSQNYIRH
jgi:hypothetical protein